MSYAKTDSNNVFFGLFVGPHSHQLRGGANDVRVPNS